MKKLGFGCLVFCAVLFAAPVRGETLYFFQQSNKLWTSAGNWFKPDPANPGGFTLAGRTPSNSSDDIVIGGGECDASGVTFQPQTSFTVTALTAVTGGTFDVLTFSFSEPKAGTGSNGLNGTVLNIKASGSMNFNIANTALSGCTITLQGGAFVNQNSIVTVSGSTIFNQGSWVIQPGASLSFLGQASRFDNIGDIRGNGGTSQIVGGPHLTLNNSGTIRADSGALVINGNIVWATDDGTGSFYPFTDDAVIRITNTFTVPANTTTFFKGPGTVLTLGNVVVNGTLQVGGLVAGSGHGPSLMPPTTTWKFDQEPGTVAVLSGLGVIKIEDEATMDWLRAAINDGFGNGAIELYSGGILNIGGINNNGTDFTAMNSGTVNVFDGGMVHFRLRTFETRASTFNNFAGGMISFDFPMGVVGSGLPATTFNNLGTFHAVAGTSSNPFTGFSGPSFINGGALNLSGLGMFQLTGGEGSGTFNIGESVDLIIGNTPYAIKLGVSFPGEGDLVIGKSGTLLVQDAATVPNLIVGTDSTPGTVDGPGNLTISSKLTYNFGTLKGAGSFTIGEDCAAGIDGSAPKTIEGKVVYNLGSTTWNGDGNIQLGSGANWNNLTGGVLDIKGDGSITGGEQESFVNEEGATFMKSGGSGTTTIRPNFTNKGLVQTIIGILAFCKFQQLSGVTELLGGKIALLCELALTIAGGKCKGTGDIEGDVIIGTTIGPAVISPGLSPGKITINGDLTMGPNAVFRVEVAGLANPGVDYDALAVTGTAHLGGALRVRNINGFTPSGNDTIVPLTAGSIVGVFDSTNAQVNYGSTSLTVAALPAPLGELLNISTRMRVLTGENVLIAGFIITGSEPKKVIIRGIGPSLGSAGVQGALGNPTLSLHQGATTLASNDDWKENQAEVEATTIPPTNDLESAIVATLNPGAYTAILAGKSGGTGIGLVEVYDLAQSANSQLANISTRGFVDTGDNVMIGGVIAGPGNAASSRILIRAIGPSLQNAGVTNPLLDPTLELRNGNGGLLAANDDWKSAQQAAIEATTIPPSNDKESAILFSIAPGNYTAIVRGTNNSTGVALVELYNLQ